MVYIKAPSDFTMVLHFFCKGLGSYSYPLSLLSYFFLFDIALQFLLSVLMVLNSAGALLLSAVSGGLDWFIPLRMDDTHFNGICFK